MDLVRAMLVLSGQFETWSHDYDSSCVMAALPPQLAQRIRDFSYYAVPDMELYSDPNQPVGGREYDTHVTVKYGLQTNNPLDVLNVIDAHQIAPFEVRLGKVGVFEKDTYDVVMVESAGDGLIALRAALQADLPNDETYPIFQPHVTLAYVKRGFGRGHVGAADFAGISFNVDRVSFRPVTGYSRTIPLFGVTL